MAATAGHRPDMVSTVPLLLRLYPAAWRERYGDEFAELLASRPPKLRDRVDIVAGAIDARLHPQVGQAAADEVPMRRDTSVAAVLGIGGVLLTGWAGLGAGLMPRWDAGDAVSAAAMSWLGVAVSMGFAATFAMAAGLLLIARRYDRYLGSAGAIGSVLTAAGLVFASLGGGVVALAMLLIGTSMFALRARGRLFGTLPAIVLVAATCILVGAFVAFAMGGGQDTRLMWGLIAYGPAWLLVARHFRAPAGMPVRAELLPAPGPLGA